LLPLSGAVKPNRYTKRCKNRGSHGSTPAWAGSVPTIEAYPPRDEITGISHACVTSGTMVVHSAIVAIVKRSSLFSTGFRRPPTMNAHHPEQPDRNLAMELVRVTEAAALAAGRWVGRGMKNEGDGAAVDAMRQLINSVSMKGVIVIGEGEKDEAPMLYNGEEVGTGFGPEVDIAVDPVDGTTLMAEGRP